MSEGSQVSKVTLCVKNLKWQRPRSGIELPGQLKKLYNKVTQPPPCIATTLAHVDEIVFKEYEEESGRQGDPTDGTFGGSLPLLDLFFLLD